MASTSYPPASNSRPIQAGKKGTGTRAATTWATTVVKTLAATLRICPNLSEYMPVITPLDSKDPTASPEAKFFMASSASISFSPWSRLDGRVQNAHTRLFLCGSARIRQRPDRPLSGAKRRRESSATGADRSTLFFARGFILRN